MAASVVRAVVKNSSTVNDAFFLTKHQACPLYNLVQVMYMRHKHYNPRFRQRRREKKLFISKEFRDFSKKEEDITSKKEQKKSKQKNRELDPERSFKPRKETLLESHGIYDPYVPPEGEGKHSLLGKEGLKDVGQKLVKKAQARAQAVRQIRKHGEPNFDVKEIAYELQDIYIQTHTLLQDLKKNKNRLFDLCTVHAYSLMTHNFDRKTFRWEFVESIEPPKAVHIICKEMFLKEVYIAQVTVRMHTKQKLALYDQFGRLMYGNPDLERDVLEFVVFEKNIVDLYGKWKVHDKITPDWLPQVHKNVSVRLSEKEAYEAMKKLA